MTEYINSNIITHTAEARADFELSTRNELVMDNLSVVTQVMKRTVAKLPATVDEDDVWSAGVLGLIDAAQRFDGSREVRFKTYAETRVRGAMLDYLRSLSWAPRGLHRAEREVARARQSVEQRTCRNATVLELADELGISVDECHRLLDRVNRIDLSNSDALIEEPGPAGATVSHATHLEQRELLDLIWCAVELLPERQKLVLWLYYGEEMTMKEVGGVLEVNEARASQIHSKAIQTLREEMASRLSSGKRLSRGFVLEGPSRSEDTTDEPAPESRLRTPLKQPAF